MKRNGLLSSVVVCVLVTALALTLLVEGGWLIWPSVLLSLYVVAGVYKALHR